MQGVAKVEIGRPPTDQQLAAWYAEHGLTPNENGEIETLPYGKPPVGESEVIEQVRKNALRHEIPNLKGSAYRDTMIFVAGGPSLNDHIEEIRARCADPRCDVYTSNKTCMWMLSKGLKPKYHVIIDPTERKKLDLEYDDDITLVLGLQCHPAVYEYAIEKKKRILKFLAASSSNGEDSDVEAAKAALTASDPELIGIGGGSMAGTRMIYLAAALGYRKIEYYGFDACVDFKDGIVKNYAYSKVRNENILEVTAGNGRKFFSTIALARQADEIVRLLDNLPGLQVVVHGDSFMSNQVAMYYESRKQLPIRITPEYAKMQAEMHESHDRYGTSGVHHASRVFMAGAQIVRKFGCCDILDYGCGKETLKQAVADSFAPIAGMRIIGYDPGIAGKDAEPERAHVVVCTDVMEHIEPQCIQAVLEHIVGLTEHVAIINVSLIPAVKILPDGRNAHISLHSKEWWLSWFKRYFVIIEQADSPAELLIVGQPIPRWKERNSVAA